MDDKDVVHYQAGSRKEGGLTGETPFFYTIPKVLLIEYKLQTLCLSV